MPCAMPTMGYQMRCWVGAQASIGNYRAIHDCTQIQVTTVDVGPEELREQRNDADRNLQRYMQTVQQREGRYAITPWSIEQVLRPSGTAGTAPNAAVLYEAAFGAAANTPGTSEVYSEAEVHCPDGLTIFYGTSKEMWMLGDAIVQTIRIEHGRDEEVRVTFSGVAALRARAGAMTIDAVAGMINEPGPSTVIMAGFAATYTPEEGLFQYQVGTEVIGLTSITYSTGACVWTRAQAGTSAAAHANGTAVELYTPAAAFSGVPIMAYDCSWSVDGGATGLTLLEAWAEYACGIDFLEQEAGEDRPTRIRRHLIEATWGATFQGRDDTRQALFSAPANQNALSIAWVMGSAAGNIAAVAMPVCRARTMTPGFPADADDLMEFSVEGIAQPTAGNYNAISLTFA